MVTKAVGLWLPYVNLCGVFAAELRFQQHHRESLVEQHRQVQVETEEMGGDLKDASGAQSGAGEGEIVRWAAFLSAEVMAEW